MLPLQLLRRVRELRAGSGSLLRHFVLLFAGQSLRIGIQAVYFVALARALDPDGYGAFVGVVSLVAVLSPFSGWGSDHLLIQNVSRTPETFVRYWSNSLAIIVVTGVGLLALLRLLQPWLLPVAIPKTLLLSVGIADLVFARLVDVSGQAYLALGRMRRAAQMYVVPSIARLLSVAVLLSWASPANVLLWGWLYLISIAVAAVAAVALVSREVAMPRWNLRQTLSDSSEGLHFAIALSAQNVYINVDKAMLARLSTLAATGIYGVAYRAVEVAFAPIRSLLHAAYTRFFQHGSAGLQANVAFVKRVSPAILLYAVLIGGVLYLAAPLLPHLFGQEYAEATVALRWLSLLPLLMTVHGLAADALTGSGHQQIRSTIQVAIALGNVGLNFWLIPRYSWTGAAIASIVSDLMLAVALWLAVGYILRREAASSDAART